MNATMSAGQSTRASPESKTSFATRPRFESRSPDISEALPPYRDEVVSVEMDPPLKEVYKKLEEDVKNALKEHRGNQSVMSVALNALLLYPDRPFHLGDLYGWEFDPETQRREKFLILATPDLSEEQVYAKERRLVEEVKAELTRGRRCQIYAVYTQKRDVK